MSVKNKWSFVNLWFHSGILTVIQHYFSIFGCLLKPHSLLVIPEIPEVELLNRITHLVLMALIDMVVNTPSNNSCERSGTILTAVTARCNWRLDTARTVHC